MLLEVAHRVADLAVDDLAGMRGTLVFTPIAPDLAARWRQEGWPRADPRCMRPRRRE
jgi:hypothetical protein